MEPRRSSWPRRASTRCGSFWKPRRRVRCAHHTTIATFRPPVRLSLQGTKEPTMVRQARLPFLTFAAIATAVYATAVTMMRMRPVLRHPDAVSAGLLIDLLIVVPLAFYFLPVRRAGWPIRTLIPLFLFSLTG